MSLPPASQTTGFLSFNSRPPTICLTAPTPHPPEALLASWKAEGFNVNYMPYSPLEHDTYIKALKNLHNNLALGEQYAIICYGEAASVVLRTATKPMAHCCAIAAFYPTVLPSPKHKYPSLLRVVVHVAGNQVSPPPEECEWKCYRYETCDMGFADPTGEEYMNVEANLAWSRTLSVVRKGFKMDVDLEPLVSEAWKGKYEIDDPEHGALKTMQMFSQASPHVTILPTLEGGIGRRHLQEFYTEFFIPSLVEDFDMRLVSRTVGVDRVVDEMVVSFTHTDEVDWILPGVPPTDRYVEIPMVSIVGVRGGKLVSEHMYWDQASVLVQVGLLDPKAVPRNLKNHGLKRLPVSGVEAAKQLVEPNQERYNKLLKEHGLMDVLNGVNGVNGS
ncbi:hypothetical protein CC78DRAFT_487368 [Lojkania enalia]|uniref:Dienelactone hydrolase n=1 Tax=Lojkania enalia TaxID=147567 RepID=A0A9P4N9H1_9PLEO|nr:hypothetical protein CC78DRAFT_487368 [Didymosphaeria enalia]